MAMADRSSKISMREITAATVRTVAALDVLPRQRGYVASNALSLAEALFNPGAWYRAVYADDKPVGFVQLFDPLAPGAKSRGTIAGHEISLWRFMIDARYQGLGFGRRALDAVCSTVQENPRIHGLVSSYVPGPDSPEGFYLRYGFRHTGRTCANGTEMEIAFPIPSRLITNAP
jgi:diamine N-acetyltransferase